MLFKRMKSKAKKSNLVIIDRYKSKGKFHIYFVHSINKKTGSVVYAKNKKNAKRFDSHKEAYKFRNTHKIPDKIVTFI